MKRVPNFVSPRFITPCRLGFSPNSSSPKVCRFPLRKRPIACDSRAASVLPEPIEKNSETPIFEMRNVTFRIPQNFDVILFKDMNLKIYPGEFVLMMGANGAGKSTAINIMFGFEKVESGEFFWKGEPIKPHKMIRLAGIVLQDPGQYFLMRTVLQELIITRPYRTPAEVRQLLTKLGLRNLSLRAHPKSLSGGQMRRLAVACQLLKDPVPSLFVLDEPLAGVDWTARRELVAFLNSLKKEFAVLLISHEPGDLLASADRVVEVRQSGIREIDREVVQRAIVTRAKLKAEKRKQAIEDARVYKERMAELGKKY